MLHVDPVTILRIALAPASIAEMDRIVADARAAGHDVDEERIGDALLRRDIGLAQVDLPPIPADLAPFGAGTGRRFEILVERGQSATDREAVLSARRQYIAELRLIACYVAQGMSVEDAWRKLRRLFRLDPPQPRRRRRASNIAAQPEKPAEAPAATSPQPEAPAPAPDAPRWNREAPPPVPEPAPFIPSVLVFGVGPKKWI